MFCCDATSEDVVCWICVVCCGVGWHCGYFEPEMFLLLLCFLIMFDFVSFDMERGSCTANLGQPDIGLDAGSKLL